MVYINNAIDFTLTPTNIGALPALRSAMRSAGGKTFEQAAEANKIYQGNGLICQTQMCQSLTGCGSVITGCPGHPDWSKVLQFCGPIQSPSISYDGAQWERIPANSQQQLLSATERSTGLSVLPTPYNVVGMY